MIIWGPQTLSTLTAHCDLGYRVLPAIGQEELWDELLDISRVAGDALPGGGDAVEHAVRHIKPADRPVGDLLAALQSHETSVPRYWQCAQVSC